MDAHQRGNLFLGKIPDRGVEKKVISYLMNLRQGSSLEIISANVKKAPFVLFKDISAQRALKIAADLEHLGAAVSFVPFRDKGPSRTGTPFADSPPRPKKSRTAPPPKSKPRKWWLLVYFFIIVVISLALMIWQNFFNLDLNSLPGFRSQSQDGERTSITVEVPAGGTSPSKKKF